MNQSTVQPHSDINLKQLRTALMDLHKVLLDVETKRYQRANRHRPSTGELYHLVLEDTDFAWLRQLSELIVALDELLDKPDPVNSRQLRDLSRYVKKLLRPSRQGNRFSKKYFDAIQRDPAVALDHARVMRMLKGS